MVESSAGENAPSCPFNPRQNAESPQRESCPFNSSQNAKSSQMTSCPLYKEDASRWEDTTPLNPLNQMPDVPNRPIDKQNDQLKLSMKRVASSIPKTGASEVWLYPSPQQFYNSLRRKDKEEEPQYMESTVHVHNFVNEVSWKKVLEWEKMHEKHCASPSLTRFIGRSEDLTPTARWHSIFSAKGKPFDRHDWIIDRCGTPVRYVIDFYDDPTATDDLQVKNVFVGHYKV
ncbi:putative cytochrome C-type heme lyase [Cardiosporidium cionae]|uniref:Holocytochrome c-type synthase n=1 Tax=Cardiosporidium cionae TaxID=476202 RepID=A0ABQ7J731_9APIC|nr:putative cytochrome C-type heme lyase [Cardiosporidium cionae]|eukprot:KAF8819734.1 putative cytochrome C-type heme lyase [Cardiosporidium cionae]